MLKLGEKSIKSLYLGAKSYAKAYLGEKLVFNKIKKPYYCEVEYIESTGTQYIDTGIIGNGEFEVSYKFRKTNADKKNTIIAGARSATQHLILGQITENNKFTYGYLNNYTTLSSVIIEQNKDYEVKISYKNGSQIVTINGVNVASSNWSGEEKTDLNILLFKRNFYSDNDKLNSFIGRIYLCKIIQNGTLVRDFIPCLLNGEVGMWDKVNKVFYPNAGTGEFLKGKIIEK